MSPTGTFIFARIIRDDCSESWVRLQFNEDEPQAAQQAATMLRTADVKEIVSVPANGIRTWAPSMQVTELVA